MKNIQKYLPMVVAMWVALAVYDNFVKQPVSDLLKGA